MAVSVAATRAGDGLRPIDGSRDLGQIIELLRLVFGESLDADDRQFFGDNGSGTMNDLMHRFNPGSARLSNGFVWQIDGRIVGNATFLTTKTWDRYLVANVAVHPSYRRQGYARGLMQAVTSSIQARGGRVILLQVVKNNKSAVDLYKSLGYESIGNMTTWYASASRFSQISLGDGPSPDIQPLSGRQWRDAYALDTACVPADLNWPEPLPPDAYRRTLWQKVADFMNGRQSETWITTDSHAALTGLASITSEWGRSHIITLRVKPEWKGRLERPLVAKTFRRLKYLARRSVRIDHPEEDEITAQLLQEANFTVQRTLTHMRLDISR